MSLRRRGTFKCYRNRCRQSLGHSPLTNEDLGNLNIPTLFRDITVKGGWEEAMKRVNEMENRPALGHYISFCWSTTSPQPP